jgi:GNAT superfamily N-acetyltransferase
MLEPAPAARRIAAAEDLAGVGELGDRLERVKLAGTDPKAIEVSGSISTRPAKSERRHIGIRPSRSQDHGAGNSKLTPMPDDRLSRLMEVTAITHDLLGPYLRHLQRQVSESGAGGAPLYYPFEPGHRPRLESLSEGRADGIKRKLGEPGWRRMWGLREGARFVGHAELAGGALAAELHRATFMLGLESSHRGRGLSQGLVDAAFGWARDHTGLAWIDLAVLDGNERAAALYRRIGFVTACTLADRYRIAGQRVGEHVMTYRIDR